MLANALSNDTVHDKQTNTEYFKYIKQIKNQQASSNYHQGIVTVVCGELVGPMQIYGQVHTILYHILITSSHSNYEKVTRTGFFF